MNEASSRRHPSELRQTWSTFVRSRMKSLKMTACELAHQAGRHYSYVSLFKNEGYVPRRPVVLRVGQVLGAVAQAFAAAGMIQDLDSPQEVPAQLSPASAELMAQLALLDEDQQDSLTFSLRCVLRKFVNAKAPAEQTAVAS